MKKTQYTTAVEEVIGIAEDLTRNDKCARLIDALLNRQNDMVKSGCFSAAADILILVEYLVRYTEKQPGMPEDHEHTAARGWLYGKFGIGMHRGWNYLEAAIIDEYSGDVPLLTR